MSEIKQSYVFDSEDVKIINVKKSQADFSHKNWIDKELEPIRVKIRKYYRSIQNLKCAYCKEPISSTSPLNCHIDHIVPKSHYLDFMFEAINLCVTCADCNTHKANAKVCGQIPEIINNRGQKSKKYPNKSECFDIFHPHFDNYSEHILIINGIYINKSQKGVFTMLVCHLNHRIYKKTEWDPRINDDFLTELYASFLESKDKIAKAMIQAEITRTIIIMEERRKISCL